MKLVTRITAMAGGAVVLATAGSIACVAWIAHGNRVNELRGLMSATLQQAETVTENMDFLHRQGAFKESARKKEGPQKLDRESANYRAIPVVAGWDSVKTVAKQKGFTFLTPSRPDLRPRNPENNGAEFAEAFKIFSKGEVEYFHEDSQTGTLTVIRPVKLRAGCLQCHGDPSTSRAGNGLDELGMPMEGLREGDVKGAFVLRAPMTRDAVIWASIEKMGLVGSGILLIVVGLAFVLNRKWVVEPIAQVLNGLKEGASRIGDAARRLDKMSEMLAEGAEEQAASVQQSVASTKEIAIATDQNAHRSTSAAQIIGELSIQFREVNQQVSGALESMKEITTSAGRISKIIKTIEEISFQTNILALNAAVEAARAGEAGLGFAVVAEEVRNLSQRSSAAAKDTEALISEAQGKSKEGDLKLGEVAASIAKVATLASEMDRIIAEVNASTQQVSAGVSQVSQGVQSIAIAAERASTGATENQQASHSLTKESVLLEGAVASLSALV
jgi:archaellum component FlaC